jgi:hypothetical protein
MHRTYYDHVVANHTGDLSSGFVRRLASGQSGFNHIEACLHDIKRSERLSERCRGQELDLGWYQKDWRPFAGAGGVITCSKDMVSIGQTASSSISIYLHAQSILAGRRCGYEPFSCMA